MSTAKFHEHLNDVLLPLWRTPEYGFTAAELKDYAIEGRVCAKTAYTWMKRLGFNYCCIKKHFYTDNHERPSNVAYRLQYVLRSRRRELREPVWMSMTMEAAIAHAKWRCLLLLNDPHNIHFYMAATPSDPVSPAVAESVEFHVDLDDDFFRSVYPAEPEAEYMQYNGLRSVRYPDGRLVLHIGQDESVYKANSFSFRVWQEKDRPHLRPKGNGTGVMVSAFVSRVFGFNPRLTGEQFEAINKNRESASYADADAAEFKYGKGNTHKPALTESPFIRYLKHGQSREGWWDYNHQILQMEDVADALHVLYPDCDVSMEVDNSSGHGKGKVDGLNVVGMTAKWGGEQTIMRATVITEHCLGNNPGDPATRLKVGDCQYMVFRQGDPPPQFDKSAQPLDFVTGENKTRTLKVKELKKALKDKFPDLQARTFDAMLLPELKAQAATSGIPLTVVEGEVTKGYVGKPKGLRQVLYERGLLDPSRIAMYYNDPKGSDEEDEPFCLKQLMGKCADFLEEETQMEFIMKKLHVTVEMSPKCHPELAGQGIEYCWGKSKKYFRAQRSAIAGSINEAAFSDLVAKSLRGGPTDSSSDAPLQMEAVLRFSRRAHYYRMAYYSMSGAEDTIKLKDIEERVKTLKKTTYKEHRGVKRNRELEAGPSELS